MKHLVKHVIIIRCGLPLLCATLLLFNAGRVLAQSSLMPENTDIPAPAQPSPNAREFFATAVALLSGPTDNALSTQDAPPPGASSSDLADPNNQYHVFTQDEKDQLIKQNEPAFAKLEEGLAHPYFAEQPRSINALFPEYAKDRKLARALVLAGQVSAYHQDWGGAMRYYIDGMRMGADIPRGSILIGLLVGVACENICRNPAEEIIDRLDLGQSNAEISQLELLDEQRTPPSETLTEEKWFTQASLLDIVKMPKWQSSLQQGSDLSQQDPVALANLVNETPRTAYDNYSNYMDKLIVFYKLPWPAECTQPKPSLPTDPICQALVPTFDKGLFRSFSTPTLDRLLEIQIALHAYNLQFGSYPTTLSSLKPTFLTTLPTDPFTDGQPFKYVPQGTTYLLYSVGPDCVDDGGKPITNPANPKRPYLVTGADQKGDIVADVNL